MPKTSQNVSTVLNEALDLIRRSEAKLIVLKERAADIEVDPDKESRLEKSRNEFIEAVCHFIDLWYGLPEKTLREKMEGLVFSILVALDGESGGVPPYAVRPLDEDGNEGEDIAGCLHELFCQKSKEKINL